MTVHSVQTEVEDAGTARRAPIPRLVERLEARARSAPSSWSWLGLAALLVAGAAILIYQTRGTTFWADEWSWIIARRSGSLATYLDPHNQHLSLVPVTIYKILFATFGLRHYAPYRAVLIASDLAVVTLVFVYARRRLGGFVALLAAALILMFGPGWQNILWPFQLAWLIAIAAGIGALLALDRGDRRGDIAASVLLAISLASAGPGLAIAVGVVVDVALRRRRRDAWIFLCPIALYALWWVGYQHTQLNKHAILLLPRFMLDAAAGVLSSVTGLANPNVYQDTGTYLTWGAPLLVLAVLGLAWRLLSRPVHRRVATLLAILVSFWLFTGLGRAYVPVGPLILTATGDESRYLYVGAVFGVLLVAELARGWRPSPRVALIALVLTAAAVVANVPPLRDGTRLLQTQANDTYADLESLDLSRPIVSPGYVSNGFVFNVVTAREWFSAEHDLGSPTPSPTQIAALPDQARLIADAQLIKIQQLGLRAAPGQAPTPGSAPPRVEMLSGGLAQPRGPCLLFRPAVFTPQGAQNTLRITVPAGGVLLRAGSAPLAVSASRFSTQVQPLGTLAASSAAALRPLHDLSPAPWHVQISSAAPFTACTAG